MRLNTTFVVVSFFIFYMLLPIIVLNFTKDDKKYRFIRNLLLSSFFVLLLIGVLGKIDFNQETIYIGFDFSGGWFNKNIIYKFPKFKLDIFINLVMLIPVGEWVFLESKRRKSRCGIFYAIILGFGIGTFIEFLQFALPVTRSVQLSDLVFNAASSVIGYFYLALFYWSRKLVLKLRDKHKAP